MELVLIAAVLMLITGTTLRGIADGTKKAGEKVIMQAQCVEKETQIENIAHSKGYGEICVYIDEDNVNISVRKNGFCDDDAVKLTDIAVDNLKISPKNVKIVEVK